jgi:O-antigen/teichoic acid export membrane protein
LSGSKTSYLKNPIKQLAGQTAIYGLGTIVPRLLNYLLVPLYTRLLLKEDYGIVTEMYAYIAFFFVLLMYGMETTFFRYAEKEGKPDKVFGTTIFSVFSTSLLFIIVVWIFLNPISVWLQYPNHQDFIMYAALIVGIDAFTAIQFALLRQQNQAFKFSLIRLITVAVNVGLNIYFIWFCDTVYKSDPNSPYLILYKPGFQVQYIFISNLVSSVLAIIILFPQLLRIKQLPDFALLKKMLKYALPLLIVGVTGMVNEVSDKIIFKYLASVPPGVEDAGKYIMGELGIYGANYKLAVLMTLFIQMFRYAAEPFFFAQAKEENAKQTYADVMKYFVVFGLLIFLVVMLYIDIFKYFIGPEHWEGLYIVPVVLIANLFLGIFYNLSVWYKLNDLTKYGAIIALSGSIITVIINIILVPVYSYMGAAIGHFSCYLFMLIFSYFLSRKFYPIQYNLKRIGLYFGLAMALYFISNYLEFQSLYLKISVHTLFILVFVGFVIIKERPSFSKK